MWNLSKAWRLDTGRIAEKPIASGLLVQTFSARHLMQWA
jgi:hypothetical protein